MITNNNFDNATDAFKQAYEYVNAYGQFYGSTKAIFNSSFTILDPLDRVVTTPNRKFNKEYED